jgi:hypothetical protein
VLYKEVDLKFSKWITLREGGKNSGPKKTVLGTKSGIFSRSSIIKPFSKKISVLESKIVEEK